MLPSYQPRAGDLVRVREAVWRVLQVRAGEPLRAGERAVRVVSLRGADAENRQRCCELLEPFDRFVPAVDSTVARSVSPRMVSRRRWMRAFGALVASTGHHALADADLALLPYQLEPLLAILRGMASRVLIADAVGLGKTIQAALILRELTARGVASRVLIAVPAGLRDQWQRELRVRVGVESEIVDALSLSTRVRALPPDVNPWSRAGIIIASLDFIKQDVVLHGLASIAWDLLIVDEAHALTTGTDRAAAIHRLAQHSRVVLLLTATPHAGSQPGFDALCQIGTHTRINAVEAKAEVGAGAEADNASDDPLAIFRRTRRSLGLPTARRVRILRVALTQAERHVHDLLERYIARVAQEHRPGEPATLAMAVLRKRASSSAWSLSRTLERRLALLQQPLATLSEAAQTMLPFEADAADEEPLAWLSAPGLRSPRLERAWLSALAQAARSVAGLAGSGESKLRVLLRLLRRVREPAVIYTEYRDTLTHVADALTRAGFTVARLHGGLTRDARAESLRRFAAGEAQLLLATDAAGEGLNLQHRCRLVVNIELPWNPNRLEQRIGRVDRLGQPRTVHAIHLVSAATSEEAILDALGTRINTIAAALGDGPAVLDAPGSRANSPTDVDTSAHNLTGIWPTLTLEACEVAAALERVRILHTASRANSQDLLTALALDHRTPWITIVRNRTRGPLADLPRGALTIWRTHLHTPDAGPIEELITLLHVPTQPLLRAEHQRSNIATEAGALLDNIAVTTTHRLAERERGWRERLARRDQAIARALRADAGGGPQQPMLFADIASEIESRQPARWHAAASSRAIAESAAASADGAFEHTLMLVLVIR